MATKKERIYARDTFGARHYGCESKIDYGSWSAAERVAKRSRWKGRSAGTIMAPYHCKVCGGYHLKSVDGTEREARRRPYKRHARTRH